MAEENAPVTEQPIQIQKIYLKDASFETPNSPEFFIPENQQEPKMDMNLNTSSKLLNEGVYEVVLNVTVTLTHKGKNAFLVEIQQAGIFGITGYQADKLSYILGSYCPNILFPYVRESVTDMVTRGGFMPVWLDPVNFDALYAQQVEHQQKKAAETASE